MALLAEQGVGECQAAVAASKSPSFSRVQVLSVVRMKALFRLCSGPIKALVLVRVIEKIGPVVKAHSLK
jgi:hypothetical protein